MKNDDRLADAYRILGLNRNSSLKELKHCASNEQGLCQLSHCFSGRS